MVSVGREIGLGWPLVAAAIGPGTVTTIALPDCETDGVPEPRLTPLSIAKEVTDVPVGTATFHTRLLIWVSVPSLVGLPSIENGSADTLTSSAPSGTTA